MVTLCMCKHLQCSVQIWPIHAKLTVAVLSEQYVNVKGDLFPETKLACNMLFSHFSDGLSQ